MKIHCMLPTYNEAENIEEVVRRIRAVLPEACIVVVDDSSPDGTGGIVERISARDPLVKLVSRKGEAGRGLAGVEGFTYCLKDGADLIVEMDADLSHAPEDIPRLVEAAKDADVVLGSRYTAGGGTRGRSFVRKYLSRAAGLYVRVVLGLWKIKDPTTGFRCFRREVLEDIDLKTIESKGPSIVTEILSRCRNRTIVEVPVDFPDRKSGTSKLTAGKLAESLWLPLKWRIQKIFDLRGNKGV